MKTIITTFAIAALALVGAAPQADARGVSHSTRIYISGYRDSGSPIYSERYFIGYDDYGNPMWGERLVRQEYRPRARYIERYPRHHHHHSYRDDYRRDDGVRVHASFGF